MFNAALNMHFMGVGWGDIWETRSPAWVDCNACRARKLRDYYGVDPIVFTSEPNLQQLN